MFDKNAIECFLVKNGFKFVKSCQTWTRGDTIDVKLYDTEIDVSMYHLGRHPMPVITETHLEPKQIGTDGIKQILTSLFEFKIYPYQPSKYPNKV